MWPYQGPFPPGRPPTQVNLTPIDDDDDDDNEDDDNDDDDDDPWQTSNQSKSDSNRTKKIHVSSNHCNIKEMLDRENQEARDLRPK